MASGNIRKMHDINGDYVLDVCHQYCSDNNVSMKELGELLGHSANYIQASCRNGKFPPAELQLLCFKIGMDISKAINKQDEDSNQQSEMTIDEKLDRILVLCSQIGDYLGI